MLGKVLVSWTACLRSFSAFIRMSAASLRSASESMASFPRRAIGVAFAAPLIWERPANDNEPRLAVRTVGHAFGPVARIERKRNPGAASPPARWPELWQGSPRISLALNPGYGPLHAASGVGGTAPRRWA